MAPRTRKALGDVTNTAPAKNEMTSVLKPKDDEIESLRAQVADLTAALERTSISETKSAAPAAKATNPFGAAALVPAPLPPTRVKTAYNFFMKEERATRASEFDGKTQQEVSTLIGQTWKNMSDAAKAPFHAKADADKARYAAEFASYQEKRNEADVQRKALEHHFHEQKVATALAFYEENFVKIASKDASSKPSKDSNAPKHARSAYMLFCSDRHAEMAAKGGEKQSFLDTTKTISEEWNKLKSSRAKRAVATLAKYQKRADADKTRYMKEKEAYDAEQAKTLAAREKAERAEFERTKDTALKTYQKLAAEQEKITEAKKIAAEADKAAKEDMRKIREQKKAEKAAKALQPKKPRTAYNLFCQSNRAKIVEARPDATNADVMRELGALWRNLNAKEKAKFEAEAADDKVRYQKEMAQM